MRRPWVRPKESRFAFGRAGVQISSSASWFAKFPGAV